MPANLHHSRLAMAADAMPGNQILAAACLSKTAQNQLGTVLLRLEQNELLYMPRGRASHAYFPVSAVLSVQSVLEDGAISEVACIGNEGVLGAPPYTDFLPARTVLVSCTGTALCVRTDAMRDLAAGPLRSAIERNARTLISQLVQNIACSGHHTIEQRMAKWLLLHVQRSGTQQVPITHETLANILGVRRESVSLISKTLERKGVISHSRSQIIVHSTTLLAAHACECYRTIRASMAAQTRDLAALRHAAEHAALSRVTYNRQPIERRRPMASRSADVRQAERRATGATPVAAIRPDNGG